MSDTTDNSEQGHDEPGVLPLVRTRTRRQMRLLLAVIAALVLVTVILQGISLGRTNTSGSPSASASTITVTGSGTAHGTPDTVSFEIGVNTVAKSATEALKENNVRVGSLEAALIGHGVTRRNMQTSGLDIYTNTDSHGNITGFTAEDTLDVTMHKIAKAGSAIDAAAKAAGNGAQLSGLSFSISNQSKLLATAREAAMNNAYTEASQIATAGHTTLGSVVRITDQENASSVTPVYGNSFQATASTAVPIEAGSQSINVQVTVVYALKG
jgi:uncharacterized protein YggE